MNIYRDLRDFLIKLINQELNSIPVLKHLSIVTEEQKNIATHEVDLSLEITTIDDKIMGFDDFMGTYYDRYALIHDKEHEGNSIVSIITTPYGQVKEVIPGIYVLDFLSNTEVLVTFLELEHHTLNLNKRTNPPDPSGFYKYPFDLTDVVENSFKMGSDFSGLFLPVKDLDPDTGQYYLNFELNQIWFTVDAISPEIQIYFLRKKSTEEKQIESWRSYDNLVPGLMILIGGIEQGDSTLFNDRVIIRTSASRDVAYKVYGGNYIASIEFSAKCASRRSKDMMASYMQTIIKNLRRNQLKHLNFFTNNISTSISESDMLDAGGDMSYEVNVTFNTEFNWRRYEPVNGPMFFMNQITIYLRYKDKKYDVQLREYKDIQEIPSIYPPLFK